MKFTTLKKSNTIKSTILIILFSFLLFELITFFIPSTIPNIISIFYNSPVNFEAMEISFPKEVVVHKDKKSLSFHYWNKPFPILNLYRLNNLRKKTRESLENFISKKSFKIIEIKDTYFKDYKSTVIYYVDNHWRVIRLLCVYDLNLIIEYTGSKDDFKTFRKIIENIRIIRHD